MTVSPTITPQQSQQQLITEEWMMMNPHSSSSSSTATVIPPTFLEIMFLKEAEQYLYTNLLPTLLTEIRTKFIQPFVHQFLALLLRQQQRLLLDDSVVAVKDSNESFGKRILKVLHRIKHILRIVLQTYIIPLMIHIVTHIHTICHTNNSNYQLEIIYLLRYILDRYSLIQYHCTWIESLYGGGNMIRRKVIETVTATTMNQPPHSTHHYRTKLLPLNKQDHIRTALLTTILGYMYEKLLQIRTNTLSNMDDAGRPSRSQRITNHILYPCWISIYQFYNHIYYPYQYLIGTSYYMNLPNRLLRQILLSRPPQEQQPLSSFSSSDTVQTNRPTNEMPESSTFVPSTVVPSLSSSSVLSWYVTFLRNSGILLWSGCYVTQMIHYYRQRRRTLRQERLLERQQQQLPLPSEHPNTTRTNHITIVVTNGTKHPDTDGHHTRATLQQRPNNGEDTSLPLLVSSADVELLPVPLVPQDMQSYVPPPGYCPICQQPIIHRANSNDTSTMLYGYVYCSYHCIVQYLRDHENKCPMTGRTVTWPVPVVVDRTTDTTTTTTTTTTPQPPQLIRLL